MYENKAYSWSITCTTLVSLLVFPLLRLEHNSLPTMVLSTFGHSLVLPSRLQNENVAYHWFEQQLAALSIFHLEARWASHSNR